MEQLVFCFIIWKCIVDVEVFSLLYGSVLWPQRFLGCEWLYRNVTFLGVHCFDGYSNNIQESVLKSVSQMVFQNNFSEFSFLVGWHVGTMVVISIDWQVGSLLCLSIGWRMGLFGYDFREIPVASSCRYQGYVSNVLVARVFFMQRQSRKSQGAMLVCSQEWQLVWMCGKLQGVGQLVVVVVLDFG